MPTVPVVPAGSIQLGFLAPCCRAGGGERWQAFLVDALAAYPPGRGITWQGIAVLDDEANADPGTLAALRAIMPVTFGEAAAWTLARSCNALFQWAVYPSAILKQVAPSCQLIFVAHRSDGVPWSDSSAAWLGSVDQVVACSTIARAAIPSGFAPPARTIQDALDPSRLSTSRSPATVRSSWGVPAGAKVAGFLGRVDPENGPDYCLQILDNLPDPWWVVVVGEGTELAQIQAAQQADPARYARLVLAGPDADPAGAIGGCDCLWSVNDVETFGYAVAEAWYLGVPTITADSGLPYLNPSLARIVSGGAIGPADFAAAILADAASTDTPGRVSRAQSFAQTQLTMAAFGQGYRDLLNAMFPGGGTAT